MQNSRGKSIVHFPAGDGIDSKDILKALIQGTDALILHARIHICIHNIAINMMSRFSKEQNLTCFE